MAKLTIIIPVYQVRSYLDRCLNSVLSQSFKNYDIILVDDGSTDGSQDICDKYAEQYNNITVIHKSNGGLSSARNVGIEAATSKYIMFVDSDDMIHSKTAEIQISLLEHNDADACICSFQRFTNEKDIDIFCDTDHKNNSIISGLEAEECFFNRETTAIFVSSCGKVFKRSLFNSIRFPEGRLFEDEYITYRIYYKCSKIALLGDALYYYYDNENGITRNLNSNKRFDEYDAQEERIIFFANNNCVNLYRLSLLQFLHTAQWDLITCQNQNKDYDSRKYVNFQRQYTDIFFKAKQENIISFWQNYDYYILALPKWNFVLRIIRKIMVIFGKHINK